MTNHEILEMNLLCASCEHRRSNKCRVHTLMFSPPWACLVPERSTPSPPYDIAIHGYTYKQSNVALRDLHWLLGLTSGVNIECLQFCCSCHLKRVADEAVEQIKEQVLFISTKPKRSQLISNRSVYQIFRRDMVVHILRPETGQLGNYPNYNTCSCFNVGMLRDSNWPARRVSPRSSKR